MGTVKNLSSWTHWFFYYFILILIIEKSVITTNTYILNTPKKKRKICYRPEFELEWNGPELSCVRIVNNSYSLIMIMLFRFKAIHGIKHELSRADERTTDCTDYQSPTRSFHFWKLFHFKHFDRKGDSKPSPSEWFQYFKIRKYSEISSLTTELKNYTLTAFLPSTFFL